MSNTPMMKQYLNIKNQYKDSILFFRMGDFYEMFYEDAKIAARELEIALTTRDSKNNIPMAGVPHNTAESYIARLIKKGYKVAICEQVEDPKTAKGIVKREVTKVITPGTIIQSQILDEKENNNLISIYCNKTKFGIACIDISTGDFKVTEIETDDTYSSFIDEMARLNPAECIVNPRFLQNRELLKRVKSILNIKINEFEQHYFEFDSAYNKLLAQFKTTSLEGFGCEKMKYAIRAAGAAVEYLERTQKMSLDNLNNIQTIQPKGFMLLDFWTRRNLELTKTLREGEKKGSLLWILDNTQTAMGARLLREWIERPLIDSQTINKRLDAVQDLKNNALMREELKEQLKDIYDLERLMGKITYGNANCRDLIALKHSFKRLPKIKEILSTAMSIRLIELRNQIDELKDVTDLIQESIVENPPATVKEGGIIKKGYKKEIDELRVAAKEGKKWIADLEKKERERTGIKSLKVGFNKVFGYYIEVTKTNIKNVPDDYIRKQTLVNSERYITPDLKEYESKILGAEEKLKEMEYTVFKEIRDTVSKEISRIQKTAKRIAELDVYLSFSITALKNNYVRPRVDNEDRIELRDSRHPVVEKMNDQLFIPNDVYLDCGENQMAIITGPNMAGKSTYMRQVALNVIMAQIGSFVACKTAKIGVVDRIFTRVGASDDLVSGQSTFMVEMNEVANILNNATDKSLLILDEIGRGTSTYDGLSIAWAVIEYIHKHIRAKTLFATHFHELTELEGKLDGVKNYRITIKEKGEDIIFLRKIVKGGADKSYGIHVARLAGIPIEVIKKAQKRLKELEDNDPNNSLLKKSEETTRKDEVHTNNLGFKQGQLNLNVIREQNIIKEIRDIDINTMTPIEAINFLFNIKKKLEDF